MLRAKCNEKPGRAGYRVDTGRGRLWSEVRPVRDPMGEDGGGRTGARSDPDRRPGPGPQGRPAPDAWRLRPGPAARRRQVRPPCRRVDGWPARESSPAVSREDSRPAGASPRQTGPYSPAGTIGRPGCHPGSRRPAGYHEDRMGTVGTGRIPLAGGRTTPQPAGRRRARLPVWTAAREGRKMACWGRWPHL